MTANTTMVHVRVNEKIKAQAANLGVSKNLTITQEMF